VCGSDCATPSRDHVLAAVLPSGGTTVGVGEGCALKIGAPDPVFLEIDLRKWRRKGCGRQYRDWLSGIAPSQRASEALRHASMNCTWTASTAAGSAGEKASERQLSSGTFSTGFNVNSPNGIRRGALRCSALTSTLFTRRKGYATSVLRSQEPQNL
jgi:hypothetical protein